MKLSTLSILLGSVMCSGLSYASNSNAANTLVSRDLALALHQELAQASMPQAAAAVPNDSGHAPHAITTDHNAFIDREVAATTPSMATTEPNADALDSMIAMNIMADDAVLTDVTSTNKTSTNTIAVSATRVNTITTAATTNATPIQPDTVSINNNLSNSIDANRNSSAAAQPQHIHDDKLQELTRTLVASGTYQVEPQPLTAAEKQQEMQLKLRYQKSLPAAQALAQTEVIELNNDLLKRKYPVATSSFNQAVSRANGIWLEKYPLPRSAVRVSSTYGARVMDGRIEHHQGLDLAAPIGTPVYATGAGLVTRAGWGNGYGQYVEINHGNGYLTRYGHASRLHVQVGDRVTAGQQIANVGCTGRCTGPHLHYEVVKDGERRNPASYLALLNEQ